MNLLRRALRVLPLLVCVPGLLEAGTARIATTATAKELLGGEALGTAITAEGRLTLGEPLAARSWPDDAADAVPFAAVADSSGRVFVATGGGIGRLFVSTPDGKLSLLWTAPEPNVTAVALVAGAVVCGTSPNGKLYRVDPEGGEATEIADPGEAAIWAIAAAPDGTLYVGTGNKGRVYRLRRSEWGSRSAAAERTPKSDSRDLPAGRGAQLFVELDDTHVRSLHVAGDGRVIAGTSDRGLLVAVTADGVSRTLHDFSRPEVVAIAEGSGGVLYAAATSGEPPSLGDSRGRPGASPVPTPTPAPGGAPKSDEVPKGSVSVSTGPARLAPSAPLRESGGGAEVITIAKDGFVEPAWTFPDETVYSARWDAARAGLVLTTGPRGRVYTWKERHLTLEAQTEQKQAVAAPAIDRSFAVVTMNAPGVQRPAKGVRTGTYVSASRDATRLSRFTRLRYEGDVPAGASVAFAVRVGSSERPDATWTPWTPLSGDARRGAGAELPPARYFQWKATLTGSPSGAAPSIERVEMAYTERNARPVLENLAVLEPGAVYQRGGGSGGAVLSVTNPDESGIYAGLEPAREGSEGPGKRLWRKGYRTVTWKGTDPNGDSLRYDVDARRDGESVWFPIRKDLEETWLSFDTTALPDGRYRLRVTASDRYSNAEGEELTARDESPIALVDNTAPALKITSTKVEKDEVVVAFRAEDALSPLSKAEAAVNADRWRTVLPEDGATDTPAERYVFRVKKPAEASVFAFRVVDAAGNVSADQVEVK